MMYDVVLESLCVAKLYVTPTLVSTYAIEDAFPVVSVKFKFKKPTTSEAL
jgi:hypothetical protein